jgi:hypothetical protein
MTVEQLTAREAQALEHLRKAEELDVTIAEYCRSFELDVKDIYSAKQSLTKKGLLPKTADGDDPLADFVEVQVAPLPPSAEPVCRIRCPNGLVIECVSWPTAQWIVKLAGCAHVPA